MSSPIELAESQEAAKMIELPMYHDRLKEVKRLLKSLGLYFLVIGTQVGAMASDWEPYVRTDNQIFPSVISAITTADAEKLAEVGIWRNEPNTLGDAKGIVGVRVKCLKGNEEVSIRISGQALLDSSEALFTLPAAGKTYTLYPALKWQWKELTKVRQPSPETFEFAIKRGEGQWSTENRTLQVRSVNDCPYSEGKQMYDYAWMFSAFVNENHPKIDEILKDARKEVMMDGWVGYQAGPDAVYRQVFAIWTYLHHKGVKYSNITTPSAESDRIHSQHVRRFSESLEAEQANCVDGTVLMASILRKLGINTYLILRPGHMYLAFDLSAKGQIQFLETTMIGEGRSAVEGNPILDPNYYSKPAWANLSRGPYNSFQAALQAGAKDAEIWSKKRMLGRIDIQQMRSLGIQPISEH
jgi:hypothetical protein